MKQLGEIQIDSLEFARGERVMRGVAPLSLFVRLADQLADHQGDLTWQLRGEYHSQDGLTRKPFLLLEVAGELQLKCQRCLGALPFQLDLQGRLLLIPPGGEWPDESLEEDDYDAIDASAELCLLDLIEDEILLALPLAPTHASCELPGRVEDRNAASPFAVLAQIKKNV